MKLVPTVNLYLTPEEKNTLAAAADIFDDLWYALDDDDVLVTPETGEAISANEIPRVRGILSGLVNITTWEVEKE